MQSGAKEGFDYTRKLKSLQPFLNVIFYLATRFCTKRLALVRHHDLCLLVFYVTSLFFLDDVDLYLGIYLASVCIVGFHVDKIELQI